jgi:hypothetical protein
MVIQSEKVLILRIKLQPSYLIMPFTIKAIFRKPAPCLSEAVFTCCYIYVTFSRVRKLRNIKMENKKMK